MIIAHPWDFHATVGEGCSILSTVTGEQTPPRPLSSHPVGTKFWAAPPKHNPTQTPGCKQPRRRSG
eukprot:12901535-Prorocentrum_lima.AAC.1